MPIGFVVAALTMVVSWGVRQAIERQLALGEAVPLLDEMLRLTRGENSGIAFGLLRGSPLIPWLSAAGVIAMAILVAQQRSRLAGLAWGLVLGGGLANVIDRIDDGRVTDYITVSFSGWRYPTFNLPDVAITIGIIVLLSSLILGDTHGGADAEASRAVDREAR